MNSRNELSLLNTEINRTKTLEFTNLVIKLSKLRSLKPT